MGGGGLPNLLQYYNGEGGVSRDPKFVLRNIWMAPNQTSATMLMKKEISGKQLGLNFLPADLLIQASQS